MPDGSVKHLEGDAATHDELLSCTIGGCCGKDTPLLPPEALNPRLAALPNWTLSADGKTISRQFVARHWQAAIDFLNALSAIAEEEGHHPDVHLTNWRDVRVDLTTHAIGGLSLPDLVIAAKLDNIDVDYSPRWMRERNAAST